MSCISGQKVSHKIDSREEKKRLFPTLLNLLKKVRNMRNKPDLICNNEECGWKGSVKEALKTGSKIQCPKCESTNLTDNRVRLTRSYIRK